MYRLGYFLFLFVCYLHNIVYKRPVMDCNLCAKFHLHILPGFWDMLVETEQQQQQQQQQREEEFWKQTFLNRSTPIMLFLR